MKKAIKKQDELKQEEMEKKVKVFQDEYQALAKKHGFDFTSVLTSSEKGIFAVLRIVEVPKESAIIKA